MPLTPAFARALIHEAGVTVERVQDAFDFFHIYDVLQDAQSEYARRRSLLLDAYVSGRLYHARVDLAHAGFADADVRCDFARAMLSRARAPSDAIATPSFCVLAREGVVALMWTRADVRGAGLGTAYLTQLGVAHAMPHEHGCAAFFAKRRIARLAVDEAYGAPPSPRKRARAADDASAAKNGRFDRTARNGTP